MRTALTDREFTVRFSTRALTFRARVRDRAELARLVRTRQVIRARVRVAKAASTSGRSHCEQRWINLALVEEIL